LFSGFERLAGHYERIAAAFADELIDYVGGTSPRQVVSGKLVTATEIPAPFSIPIHQEMSYTANAPDVVAFFGQQPATKGGRTLLADMRRVTARVEVLRPRYENGGLRLRRALPPRGAEHKKPGVQKAWNEVFSTDDRDRVAEIAKERGWEIRWLDDDFLQLSQEVRPAYKTHPETGEVVWFNQMHIFPPIALLDWAKRDGRTAEEERLNAAIRNTPEWMDQVVRGDGSVVSDQDVRFVNDAYLAEAIPLDWKRGDVLIMDNVYCAHGREPFEGERRLLAALGRRAKR
jgi:alpha-ketoglutarate-dependent taurine dioxygenase